MGLREGLFAGTELDFILYGNDCCHHYFIILLFYCVLHMNYFRSVLNLFIYVNKIVFSDLLTSDSLSQTVFRRNVLYFMIIISALPNSNEYLSSRPDMT